LEPDVAIEADVRFAGPATPVVVMRNLDVVLVALALVPALALGAPVLGCVLGAGGWVLQRMIAAFDRRWTGRLSDPLKRLTVNLFEAFGRIWLLVGVIVVAAVVGGRPDGRAATLMIFGAYSIAFVIRLVSGPPRPGAVK